MKYNKFKNALAVAMLFLLATSGGIATARFSGTARMVSNSFSVLNGQKKQQDAGILKEPDWDNGGKDLAAKGMKSGEAVPKNPYIVSNADWTSWAFMKVDIPLFADGTDSVSLLNLSDNWKLLKDEVNGSVHTKIYGYKTRLAGGNSKKSESDRAKTDSLFDSFKACNTSADKPFIGSLNVCGTLVQSDDTDDLAKIVERAEFDDSAESEAIFRISYDLDDGTLTGQKYLYTKDDYGYAPPTPVKDGFGFTGWSPASIPDGSIGDITFTSGWTPNILTINYHSNGANSVSDVSDEKSYTLNSTDSVVFKYTQKYPDKALWVYSSQNNKTTQSANYSPWGLADTNRLRKNGYHVANGNKWRIKNNGELADASANLETYTGADVANFLGVLPSFKKGDVTVDLFPEWAANTYTIKYNANAPTGATSNGRMADTVCTYDKDKTLSTNAYSINNYYSFLSWNTKANGSGTSYADGTSVKNLTSENNGTVTLYAQWKLATKSWDYNYTGGVQSWTCPATGTYKLETLGAQAGYNYYKYGNRSANGAQGGYTSGMINITKGTTLYICVGGRGGSTSTLSSGAGGYNGGGAGGIGYYSGATGGSGGGGATHIATTNRGVLSNYASNQNEVLIVAGGGGGCAYGINGTTGGDGNTTYQFGQGQAGKNGRSSAHEGGGGGGGGWYGGAYGSDDRANSAGMAPAYGGTNHINSKLSSQVSRRGGRDGNGFARITIVR